MYKRFITLVITILLTLYGSLMNVLPVFAENNNFSTEKNVISEDTSNTNDAIDSLREKLNDNKKIRIIVGLTNGSHMPDEIKDSKTIERVQKNLISNLETVSKLAIDEVKTFKTIPFVALSVTEEGFEQLLQNPNVVSIEEDIPTPLVMAESNGIIGSNTAWDLGFTGKGQTVAVLDTGVDNTHSFLKGKVISEACFSTTDSIRGSASLCPDGNKESTAIGSGMDCDTSIDGCGHGTHVAGTIAGKEITYYGEKLSGVAKDANIIAIQVFSKFPKQSGDGYEVLSYSSDQISALERVLELKNKYNISSVNMSLGAGWNPRYCDESENEKYGRKVIIDNLRKAGIAVVIASGNNGYTDGISAPSCISSAISVGATSKSDVVAYFSNSAEILDLLAPGMDITSSVPGNQFESWSGTSMAAPHVAGAWAILKEMKPSASVEEILTFLQHNGKMINDYRNNITKPRIDLKKIDKFSRNIVSLEAKPSKVFLSQGKTHQLQIYENYSDNTYKDVTTETTFKSSNTKRAVVSEGGLITIPADATNGTVEITSTYGDQEVTILVTVEPEITKLELNQSTIVLVPEKIVYFKLTAIFSDRSTKDITNLASYDIIDGDGNSVKNQISINNGTVRALPSARKGSYTLVATYHNKEFREKVEFIPALTNIRVDSQKIILNQGKTHQLQITAVYSDTSHEDVTTKATYTSSNTKRAAVSERGLITIPADATNGTVNITAKYGNRSVVTAITVEPVVTKVEFDPSTVLLELGKTARVKLTATYQDGKKKDITSLASYVIVDGDNQSVKDQITITQGTLKALSTAPKGNYTLIAMYQDKETRATIEAKPVLTKLTADTQKVILNQGKTYQLQMTAAYSDAGTEDVTTKATYTSSNTKRAAVSGRGLITIPADATNGTVNITAKYGNRSVVTAITVEPVVTKVEFEQSTVLLELGKTVRVKLTATYQDGKKKDITGLASYYLTDEGDQLVKDQITITQGTLKALSTAPKGNYTLIAMYQDKETRATIEAKPVLIKLTADTQKVILNQGKTYQLQMTAAYSDASTEDVTTKATYTSSNTKRVEVSEEGFIIIPDGASNGTASITTKFGGRTVVITVIVSKDI
ncbi:S8 family serine peptidase [Bacillus sp. S/N-304-OC-R1]|uniref:S8 family serine peptidase n=1 Tax=Bacillus sp. S/N-304-OC-R1 TaxID=2758034 RepID=UPI001C8EDDE3|nr:S8 family serine peptidase [Bacillus sp. S/N-304-OC-R1]MBY0122302.1 S8 family serine peptidase [Bacillus sp. S/N-304-OC-R1]